MGTSWYSFTHPNRTTLYFLYTSLCTGELNAIRKGDPKEQMVSLQSSLRKGVLLSYVGLNLNQKDLKNEFKLIGIKRVVRIGPGRTSL